MALPDLSLKFEEVKTSALQVEFSDVRLSEEFKSTFKIYIEKHNPIGYNGVEWAEFSAKITTTTGKSIFLPNYWFYLAAELSGYLDDLTEHRELFKRVFPVDQHKELATELRSGVSSAQETLIRSYLSNQGHPAEDYDLFVAFLSDQSSWGGGKTVDRDDYFVSPLMKAGNLLAETQTGIAELARLLHDVPEIRRVFQPIFVNSPARLVNIGPDWQFPKPFIMLAGISGTGKTRFVRAQAAHHDPSLRNLCLVPVRPDWHEPSDLIGYKSRLSGTAEYITTDVLRFICKAWSSITDSGVVIETGTTRTPDRLCKVVGDHADLKDVIPYWLCLDEMNLAPVEQYFADYLSILETREWHWDGLQFTYLCDPLLSSSAITDLDESKQKEFRSNVGLEDTEYDLLWSSFYEHGIGIPFNLIVAGTVNMDETTHGFSRKVLDRALTIDFDEFFPNDFSTFFKQEKSPVTFTYPVLSRPSQDKLPAIDSDGGKSIAFLEKINSVLNGTPFKVAYRAVNELLLMVTCLKPTSDLALKAVWDDFLMLKVLSRIEGDVDKLGHGQSDNTVLIELLKILEVEFSLFWDKDAGMAGARPDLFLISTGIEEVTTGCRSKAKITWMQNRLEVSGFTSFWP